MQNNESGVVAMTQEVRTLHTNVLPLIGASAVFLQLQPQSPFQTHYKTMVTSLIAACVYVVTGLASIKFNGFIKEVITEVSLLSGLLSPLLMFLTMFPPLGWVCLVLWAISVFIIAHRMISSRRLKPSQQVNQLRSRPSDNDEDKHVDDIESPKVEPEQIRKEKLEGKLQNERQDVGKERKPKEVELPRGNASVSDQTSAMRGSDDDDDDADKDDTESSEKKQQKEQHERKEKLKAKRLTPQRGFPKVKILSALLRDDDDDDEDEDDTESQMDVPGQMTIGIAVEKARKEQQKGEEAVDMMEKLLEFVKKLFADQFLYQPLFFPFIFLSVVILPFCFSSLGSDWVMMRYSENNGGALLKGEFSMGRRRGDDVVFGKHGRGAAARTMCSKLGQNDFYRRFPLKYRK